ncbi:MAG: leucine-rich repeat protein [Alistipes sp.]|nr:leucine-rich repeat protein [Alistipes sp.]
MKLIKYLSFLLPLFIVGCETTVGLNIDEVVTSYTESLSFTAEGGEDAIEFDIPCDWEASISEDADWLTLNKYSGNRGRNYINVTAEENKTIEAREAVITIYNDIYGLHKDITVYQEANDPYITLSNNELEFGKNESFKSIEVESSIPWSATIVSNPDWLTITPKKGDNGTTTLKVTVKGNNTIDNRSANIKIENSEYKLSKVLTITQSAGDANASVSSKEISIPSEGDTKSIDIESNTTWKAKCDAEWISLSPTSGSKGKTTMSVIAEENPYAESRTATITIVDNNQKELAKINVKQGGSSAYINLSNNSIAVKFNIPYTLNIESTVTWTAEYDADIVSVTPNSGIGKVDATITIIGQTTDSVDVRFYNNDYSVSTTLHITPDYTNCIFYTTSDGNIVSPYKSNGFGATIISNEIINGIGAIVFDDSVTTIGGYAFDDCSSLTSITIPNSVTTIGEGTFSGCSSLTSVTIPDSVTTIGWWAFDRCESLTSVTIPDSVTTIGWYAFQSCESLTSVYISDIAAWCNIPFGDSYSNPLCYADNLYLNNELVTDLTIPDSVTTIGNYAFYDCDCLTSVTIPDSVTTIGNYAFCDCDSLTSITIPNSVTTIGDYAFYHCNSLTSVTIPDSVTTIGWGAFESCSSLTSVYISDISAWCNISFSTTYSNPLYYAHNLYLNNELVTDLIIPDSVTTIGSSSFRYCTSLTSVTIGDSVTTIGDDAFYDCGSLTSVTIGDSVTMIGSSAFRSCESLTSVTIPNSVTTIGDDAFLVCRSLTSVTIGNSVMSIGDSAFSGCSSLTSVYCKPTTPPAGGSYMFGGNASGHRIYVPMESVEAYKDASYWSEYADAIEGYNF